MRKIAPTLIAGVSRGGCVVFFCSCSGFWFYGGHALVPLGPGLCVCLPQCCWDMHTAILAILQAGAPFIHCDWMLGTQCMLITSHFSLWLAWLYTSHGNRPSAIIYTSWILDVLYWATWVITTHAVNVLLILPFMAIADDNGVILVYWSVCSQQWIIQTRIRE